MKRKHRVVLEVTLNHPNTEKTACQAVDAMIDVYSTLHGYPTGVMKVSLGLEYTRVKEQIRRSLRLADEQAMFDLANRSNPASEHDYD